ncbi:energy transducer TonB [Pseudofulvibacter geojedonensis]|uniref:Energy transducer TonB n=1 Tax=Pseudofulvibacter geojedonensis TaxID=1123758 RepID=A0ABW3I1E9_9FLAO
MHLNIFKKKANQGKRELSMREKKHQANLRKNGGLHFQIGLIVTLFVVFGVFQLKFEKKEIVFHPTKIDEEVMEIAFNDNYVIEEEKVIEKREVVKQKQPKVFDKYQEVDNDKEIEKKLFEDEKKVVPSNVKVEFKEPIDEGPVDIDPIPVNLVQSLPLFPGCEKFSDKKKQMECFSKKIAKHINKKFDSEVAAENGITGKQRINVAFVINDKGEVVDVQARAAHPALQKEAIKAVNSLPKMKPAKQGYKKVPVRYALPISFQVND